MHNCKNNYNSRLHITIFVVACLNAKAIRRQGRQTRRSLKTRAMNHYPASPVRSLPAPSVGGQ
ncbi:hypothetical protein FHY08_001141 [Pseudomonas koreensis]|nr:hypothetical protein [Pseudomonas koreensis]